MFETSENQVTKCQKRGCVIQTNALDTEARG